jgi:hypothetical protein
MLHAMEPPFLILRGFRVSGLSGRISSLHLPVASLSITGYQLDELMIHPSILLIEHLTSDPYPEIYSEPH